MVVHCPPQILPARFGQHVGGVRTIHGDVMLKAIVADVMHQFLETRDFRDGAMAEGFKFVICSFTLTNVAADNASGVVGAEPCISKRPSRSSAFHRAVSVLDSKC